MPVTLSKDKPDLEFLIIGTLISQCLSVFCELFLLRYYGIYSSIDAAACVLEYLFVILPVILVLAWSPILFKYRFQLAIPFLTLVWFIFYAARGFSGSVLAAGLPEILLQSFVLEVLMAVEVVIRRRKMIRAGTWADETSADKHHGL